MDIRKVKKLIELIEETGVAEIEIHEGEESVRISKHSTSVAPQVPAPQYMPAPVAPAPDQSAAPKATHPASDTKTEIPKGHMVKSPMVGTAYLSSTPGEKPFVEVGDRVKIGDTICLIEAMKMFNQIEADKDGIISARMIENEQPVEYDQPLFVIEE